MRRRLYTASDTGLAGSVLVGRDMAGYAIQSMLFMGGKSDDCAATFVFLLGLSVVHGCGSLLCLGGVLVGALAVLFVYLLVRSSACLFACLFVG